MSLKIDYREVVSRIKDDVNYVADEAYNKGYKIGKLSCSSKIDEESYQRGLDDAWEAARKIVLNPEDGGMTLTDFSAVFSNRSMQSVFKSYSASEAIAKLKDYEEKQKADEEIKVGDFSGLIVYLSQFDESDAAKVKYIRQKIEAAIGENIDWYERRKS